MNYDVKPEDVKPEEPLDGFYRVSATNTETVVAATNYIGQGRGLNTPLDQVAIVNDDVHGDDYIETLTNSTFALLA
jgi:hypothetical protein